MTRSMEGGEKPVARRAVHGMEDEARRRRGPLAMTSPQRHFYLGVEAATMDLLRPEAAGSRPAGWLEKEYATLRDG
ncbi:MAG TPA: hypothetical protein VE990_10560 [Acidimicrobiales bacterium]|nr:hypothetical protein [Acidimicrobiales bacterium]